MGDAGEDVRCASCGNVFRVAPEADGPGAQGDLARVAPEKWEGPAAPRGASEPAWTGGAGLGAEPVEAPSRPGRPPERHRSRAVPIAIAGTVLAAVVAFFAIGFLGRPSELAKVEAEAAKAAETAASSPRSNPAVPPPSPRPERGEGRGEGRSAEGQSSVGRTAEGPTAIATPPPAPQPPPPRPRPLSPEEVKARALKSLLADALRERDRGHPEAALELYAQALASDPANAEALAGRGACYLDRSQYAPARASFEAALGSDAENGAALMGLAETFRYEGRRAEAVSYYERYLAAHPHGTDAVAARNAMQALKE